MLTVRLVAGEDEDLLLVGERPDRHPDARAGASAADHAARGDVLALLCRGLTVAEVAARLGISRHTAARHVERVYAKLGVHTRAAATTHALRALAPPN